MINMRHYIEAAGEIMYKKMRRNNSIIVLYLLSAIILAGCAPKTFVELLSRNDNDISRDGMPYSYKRFVAVVLLLCVFCCGVYTLSR